MVLENSLRDNGGLRVSLAAAARWHIWGHTTQILVLEDAGDGVLLDAPDDIPLTMLSRRGARLRRSLPLSLIRLLRAVSRSDIIVSGSEVGFNLLLGWLAARLTGRPFAVLVQGDIEESINTWVPPPLVRPTRRVLSQVDAALCVADSLTGGLRALGLSAERIHVVPNGIDVDSVRRAAAEPADVERAHRSEPTVLAIGRLCPQKDFVRLISAHAQVLAEGLPHRLRILGEGPSRAEIEHEVSRLGVESSVELPGFVANPYVELVDAALFVVSSRSESGPLTVLEALAVGAPVVSTACGSGPHIMLAGGAFGEIVPVGSTTALATAIATHLRKPERLRARASGGPAQAERFGAVESAQAMLDALLSTIRAPRTCRRAQH